ncbi:GH25 family lysozyme [Dactylosporangium sp. CA-092794]|uniref:GH25 family lysozyme n=1 Tax=Dactylosporangium sp. CA-092794 TaxID=3239929 RepID=UPI003D8F9D77
MRVFVTGLLTSLLLINPAAPGGTSDGGGHAQAGARAEATGATPGPQYSVRGIDVSSHDHSTFKTIDWAGQAAQGVSFAYVKATETNNYVNPYFAKDIADAKRAGLLAGAYTFARPDHHDPVGDANLFVDHAAWANDSKTLVPFVDLEWPYFTTVGPCYNLDQAAMRAWIQAFLDQIQARIGRKAMIYTAAGWWNQCVGDTTQFAEYPLDVASWSGTAPKLPKGWSKWTLWQYAGGDNAQPGNYDKDVFNGDLDQLRRLAGIDPPAALIAEPTVIAHAPTKQVQVYTDAGHGLSQRFWSPGYGWSSWSNFGGGIAGTPHVLQNPAAGTVEVYARTRDGRLAQKYWQAGRWSDWTDLGGDLAGDPVVFYSPRYGSTEIYARGRDGHLWQRFYAGGWSGWTDLGGDLAGDPAEVLYNPVYRTTEIYARGTDGHLMQKFYASGWSAWQDLGGALAGDPAVFRSPVWGTTEIYARGAGGHLVQRYYSGTQWSAWQDLGGSLSGDPAVFYNPWYRSTEIYARDGGTLEYTFVMPGGGWTPWTAIGGALDTDPAVIANPYTGNTEIYAVSGGNLVTQLWLRGPAVWSGWSTIMTNPA